MTLIVSGIRYVSTISCNDEMSVAVAELVSHDDGSVSVFQAQHSVSMSPVVKRGTRQLEDFCGFEMDFESSELAYAEDLRIVGELLGMLGKDFPSPQLGGSDYPVSPRSL